MDGVCPQEALHNSDRSSGESSVKYRNKGGTNLNLVTLFACCGPIRNKPSLPGLVSLFAKIVMIAAQA